MQALYRQTGDGDSVSMQFARERNPSSEYWEPVRARRALQRLRRRRVVSDQSELWVHYTQVLSAGSRTEQWPSPERSLVVVCGGESFADRFSLMVAFGGAEAFFSVVSLRPERRPSAHSQAPLGWLVQPLGWPRDRPINERLSSPYPTCVSWSPCRKSSRSES